MYHYKKHTDVKFARVGGLSSVPQKGYESSPEWFHSPPARKGIYAFTYPYIDFFLLSGSMSEIGQKHSKYEYVKNSKGEIVEFPMDQWKEAKHKAYIKNKIGLYDWHKLPKSQRILSDNPPMENKEFNKYRFYGEHYIESRNVVRFLKRKDMRIFEYTGEIWCHLGDYVKKHSEILKINGDWVLVNYDTFVNALNRSFHEIGQNMLKCGFKPSEDFTIMKHLGKDHLEVFIEKI